jgi:hypothetical protein
MKLSLVKEIEAIQQTGHDLERMRRALELSKVWAEIFLQEVRQDARREASLPKEEKNDQKHV